MSLKLPSDAFVIQVGDEYLVRPATVVVREKVTFRNLTESAVTLFLPWGEERRSHEIVELAAKDRGADTKTVDLRDLPAGAYPYVAFVAGRRVFAQGESDPKMIIDC